MVGLPFSCIHNPTHLLTKNVEVANAKGGGSDDGSLPPDPTPSP